MKADQEINYLLQQKIYKELSRKDKYGEETYQLQEIFMDSYCKMLQLCFKISLNPYELQKHIDSTSLSDGEQNYKFIAHTIENERSYEIMNEFLNGFLKLLETEIDEK